MAKFSMQLNDYTKVVKNGKSVTVIKKEKFESFNEDILGLGNIETKSTQVNALSVLFDLEGFTNFCKQIDPQLAVPEYLSDFLKWLFEEVRNQLTDEKFPEGYRTYSELPFLSKYMGDGVLFIWDVDKLSDVKIINIVLSMYQICENYRKNFYKVIAKKIVSPPKRLRCGIARGAIYSVGNGNDFVGPCINMSARLQKLNSLTFSFSRRGLNPDINASFFKVLKIVKTDIRGIGEDEIVCVLKNEYMNLETPDKEKFTEL